MRRAKRSEKGAASSNFAAGRHARSNTQQERVIFSSHYESFWKAIAVGRGNLS